MLPPGLVDHDGHRVRQVQAAVAGTHRDAHAPFRREPLQHRLPAARASPGRTAARRRAGRRRRRCDGRPRAEKAQVRGPPSASQAALQVRVIAQLGELVVVEAGTAQAWFVQLEAQRPHQVQRGAGVGAQAYDIARVRRDLRLRTGSRGTYQLTRRGHARQRLTTDSLALDFCGLQFRFAHRAAVGLRGLRRRVHAGRRLLQPRRRRHRAQGHHRCGRASATRRTASTRRRMGMLNAIGLQNPGVEQVVRRDSAHARFHRDPLHRQCLRLHDRGVRRGHAAVRRLAHRRHRDQHLLSQRQGGRRGVRQLPGHVGPGGRSLPRGHHEAADHQAVAQPDRHPGKRAPLHRGRHRRLRRDQHGHGHGHRRGEPRAGDRQRAGRPVGPGDQADRTAQGAPGVPGRARSTACRSSARAASSRRSDALEFIIAGASAVGIGTALFYDPLVCRKINDGIRDYLQRHGFSSVANLVGTLELPGARTPAAARA